MLASAPVLPSCELLAAKPTDARCFYLHIIMLKGTPLINQFLSYLFISDWLSMTLFGPLAARDLTNKVGK